MLTPTTGDVLDGIHRELKEQVLAELPQDSVASRQLRSALHALQQVARTWDLQHTYLATDNADLETTLSELEKLSGIARRRESFAALPLSGVTDPELCSLITHNLELQAELVAFQSDWRAATSVNDDVKPVLSALHQRLVTRAATAAGVIHD